MVGLSKRALGLGAGLLVLAMLVAACGGGGGSSSTSRQSAGSGASAQDTVVVELKNMSFQPKEIRVKTGQKVVFKNSDSVRHNVVQTTTDKAMTGPYGFESPVLTPGSSWEYTFNQPGEYPILCSTDAHYLAGMTAKIIVEN